MAEPDEALLKHTITPAGDGTVVVVLEGELDIATAVPLNEAVRTVIDTVTNCLVVDAGQLRFADSSAIALWVSWSQRVPRIEIRNPSPIVRRVIETMGLETTLNPS